MSLSDKKFYFDANALWKYYRDEKGSLAIRRLVSNSSDPILISYLTRLECFSVLLKQFRQGHLKRKWVNKLVQRLRRDTNPDTKIRPFTIVTWSDHTFRLAEGSLLQYADRWGIGSHDSLHIAIAIHLQASFQSITFVTSDRSLKEVCQELKLPTYDPEISEV